MNTDTKPKNDLDWMDAPIESDKWRNLLFDKNGLSYRGIRIFKSEMVAKIAADGLDKEKHTITMDGIIPAEEYSHVIQMPL